MGGGEFVGILSAFSPISVREKRRGPFVRGGRCCTAGRRRLECDLVPAVICGVKGVEAGCTVRHG